MECEKSISLWSAMYQLHWDYIQTEENSVDLITKKDILKDCTRTFLSQSVPDRRFFLPQTVSVLKGSIFKLKKFSAYDASMAFDAIAQYANNLITKPWRQEYKVIKTHSGFYQHKIKAQLYDVDEMFIAMGYSRSQNQTLVFDGPTCPDQLENVSRDCMIACEECLIMYRIYYELEKFKINISWREIYIHRQEFIGDERDTTIFIQQQKNAEKLAENYGNHVPALRCNCSNMATIPQYHYQQHPYQMPNTACIHHPQMNQFNYCSQYDYPLHTTHIPHSMSMERYNDRPGMHHEPFRHSFDRSNDGLDEHIKYGKPFNGSNQVQMNLNQSTPNYYNHSVDCPSVIGPIRVNDTNPLSNKCSLRNYDNHNNRNHHHNEDLIKFEENPKITNKSYGRSHSNDDMDYIVALRQADHQMHRSRHNNAFADLISNHHQKLHSLNHSLEYNMKNITINDENGERLMKNRKSLAEYETDEQNSRDSRASDFDSVDCDFDEENARASRNKDGQGSAEEWSYRYKEMKKNNQQNENGFIDNHRNGNDNHHQKNLGKRQKQENSDFTENDRSAVSKDQKNTKSNKIRASKVGVDEYELQKSKSAPKKQTKTTTAPIKEWSCEHCTYLNSEKEKICSMCSKSRGFTDKPTSKSIATAV